MADVIYLGPATSSPVVKVSTRSTDRRFKLSKNGVPAPLRGLADKELRGYAKTFETIREITYLWHQQ